MKIQRSDIGKNRLIEDGKNSYWKNYLKKWKKKKKKKKISVWSIKRILSYRLKYKNIHNT